MASSSSPLVTRVGLRVLEQGGNAVDAAVAMAGMLALAEPMMSGLGGDTMVLVWSAKDQKVFGLNGSGRAPSGASLERMGSVPVMPEHGAATVTIPGAVDGWCALLERFGTQSLQQLWEPVIAYAREGYPVGESSAGFWDLGAALLGPSASGQLRELLLSDGTAPQPGQLMRLPQLAATLEHVAREGRQGLYEGPVAEAIATTISAGGVPTTLHDVAAQQHRAEWVEPLSVGFRGREVLGMPPNCQGLTQILVNALDRGMNPQQAVDAPRFKLIMQSGAVHIDPQFSLEVGNALVARGHQFGDSYGFASFKGAAQMLRIHRDATGQCTSLEAGVDHRLDGVALGF
jgi:gamma-glutamyltranspeptidase/glutathione hydrolase